MSIHSYLFSCPHYLSPTLVGIYFIFLLHFFSFTFAQICISYEDYSYEALSYDFFSDSSVRRIFYYFEFLENHNFSAISLLSHFLLDFFMSLRIFFLNSFASGLNSRDARNRVIDFFIFLSLWKPLWYFCLIYIFIFYQKDAYYLFFLIIFLILALIFIYPPKYKSFALCLFYWNYYHWQLWSFSWFSS